MVNVKRTTSPPVQLKVRLLRAQKGANPGVDTETVRKRLRVDFSNKCYLCESTQSDRHTFIGGNERIEHFLPHKGGTLLDRMYSWRNLFLACDYCNGAKGQQEDLIDCTGNNYVVTDTIEFKYEPGTLKPLINIKDQFRNDRVVENTRALLHKIYNEPNSHLQLDIAARIRLQAMNSFRNFLTSLEDLNDHPRNATKEQRVREQLGIDSEYLSFKIAYIKSSTTLMAKFGALLPPGL